MPGQVPGLFRTLPEIGISGMESRAGEDPKGQEGLSPPKVEASGTNTPEKIRAKQEAIK